MRPSRFYTPATFVMLAGALCMSQVVACGSDESDEPDSQSPAADAGPTDSDSGGQADIQSPDVLSPDVSVSDVSVSDISEPSPDVLSPDVEQPDTSGPDVSNSDVETDTSTPDVSNTDVETDIAVSPDVVEEPVYPVLDDVIISLDDFELLREAGVQVVDSRSALEYTDGHIPGAVNVSWNAFVIPDRNGIVRESPSELQEIARGFGIDNDVPIVVYGNWGDGAAASGRLFWTLEYIGHEQVYLLDGGFNAWKELGITVETTPVTPEPGNFEVDLRAEIRVTLDELLDLLLSRDPNIVILDSRTLEEWLGDNLRGNPRGGHIPDAVHYHWLDLFDLEAGVLLPEEEIRAGLASRGITEDTLVVPYCQSGVRSGFFYVLLRDLGFPAPRNYDGSFWEWSRAEGAPVIVEPDPWDVIISLDRFEDIRAEGAIVIDSRSALEYTDGHIPGAFNVSWNAFTAPGRNGIVRDSGEELQTIARGFGLRNDVPLLIYGNWGDGAAGSGRLFWTLEYIGHDEVYLLDGNFDLWKTLGIPVETTVNTPTASDFVVTLRPEIRATLAQVTEFVTGGDPNVVLIDTRTLDEWLGDNLRGNPRGGHIPNAVHYHWLDLFDLEAGILLTEEQIRAGLAERGIDEESVIVPYCQSGVRSGFFYVLLRDLGFPAPLNYDGSFWEWSREEELPIIVEGSGEPVPTP
jgi:thiosulfate/3-mercaptopyruvate sulfurtransferase